MTSYRFQLFHPTVENERAITITTDQRSLIIWQEIKKNGMILSEKKQLGMEREKRKKMSQGESGGETKKKMRKEERETAPAEVEVEEPTTEAVEEFYAILRRMDVALRYLKEVQKRPTERRAAAVFRIRQVEEHMELNLNEVPPADSTD